VISYEVESICPLHRTSTDLGSSMHATSTLSNDLLPVLVASFPSVRDLVGVVAATLEHATLTLDVDETPQAETRYALELTCPGYDKPLAVLAKLAGRREDAGFPLALRPLGRQGEAALEAFLEEHSSRPVSEPAQDPLRGRLLGGGRYEIESEISSGSIGRVYRGRHLLLNRPIAVKLLHEELAESAQFIEHFNGEARAASRLDHPNICRVFDFGEDDDGLRYIVMELLEGLELGQIVESEGPLPLEVAVDFGAQICAALSTAHERGIVHRDIKAENIVAIPSVDDDGVPTRVLKVCDFGLAMSINVSGGEQFATIRGTCGTPAYMPPEQVLGETLDARADVYACGVLLYLLSTGQLPFEAPDVPTLLSMQLRTEPKPPSTVNPAVNPGLEAVILKAMSKDRLARFATARELRSALRSLVRRPEAPFSSPVAAPPPSRRPPGVEDVPESTPPATAEHASLIDALTRAVLGAETPELSRLLGRALERRPFRLLRTGPTNPTLLLDDGTGEPRVLTSSAPGPRTALLETTLAERGVVLLTVHPGLTTEELAALVRGLSSSTAPTLSFPHLLLLTDDSRLGRQRSLPWLVDLVATEMAFSLAKVQPEETRRNEVAAALGPIRQPTDARTLLETSDLIGAATQRPAWSVACAIGAGLAQPACTRLLATLAEDVLRRNLPVPPDLLRMLASRLAGDPSQDSDELLRSLATSKLIPPEATSAPAEHARFALQFAQQLVSNPLAALAELEAAEDDASYFERMTIVEEGMGLLMNQGRLTAFAHGIRVLARHAKDLAHPFRSPIAVRALAGLQDPAFLERVALVLLRGTGASQEAAQSVILSTGSAGARALCTTRYREGAALDLAARKRFVATIKLMGAVADAELERVLRQAGAEALEVFVVEDCLRALRDGASDNVTATVMRLTEHFAPQVRRAALGAMTAILGPRVGPLLLRSLRDQDERVRLTALIGLQRVEGLGEAAVALLEEQLASGDEDTRAAAAAALRNAAPTSRPRAVAALTKALVRPKTSLTFRLGADEKGDEGFGVVAAATSLYALDPVEGRQVVEARARRADGPLRRRLLEVIAR
jgi:serine/threonine protein kinase